MQSCILGQCSSNRPPKVLQEHYIKVQQMARVQTFIASNYFFYKIHMMDTRNITIEKLTRSQHSAFINTRSTRYVVRILRTPIYINMINRIYSTVKQSMKNHTIVSRLKILYTYTDIISAYWHAHK